MICRSKSKFISGNSVPESRMDVHLFNSYVNVNFGYEHPYVLSDNGATLSPLMGMMGIRTVQTKICTKLINPKVTTRERIDRLQFSVYMYCDIKSQSVCGLMTVRSDKRFFALFKVLEFCCKLNRCMLSRYQCWKNFKQIISKKAIKPFIGLPCFFKQGANRLANHTHSMYRGLLRIVQ